jgi:hypothetical protein
MHISIPVADPRISEGGTVEGRESEETALKPPVGQGQNSGGGPRETEEFVHVKGDVWFFF